MHRSSLPLYTRRLVAAVPLHCRKGVGRCNGGPFWAVHRGFTSGTTLCSSPPVSERLSTPVAASPLPFSCATGARDADKTAAVPSAGTSSSLGTGTAAAVTSTVNDLDGGEVPLNTPAEVEEAFACSVQARTVSNVQLRRYIDHLPAKDYSLALAAVKGARAAGLRISALTYESLLASLMSGGQLRASMELYQLMIKQRMTPTPNTYAALMDMCLQRDMPKACQSLFNDLQKRGVRPSAQNYELMITSLSTEVPPQWKRAIDIFDKISRERKSRITTKTYNALMRVYMNMDPFDWRVVYNCYSEMRNRRPRVPLEWESYLILAEALRMGRAGYVRRGMAYIDAWIAVTPLRSWNFLMGAMVYLTFMMLLKSLAGYLVVWYYEMSVPSTSDSVLSR
ncbi:putative Pentatricopeptide repeat domain/PPR repeat [Leishmania naiffi]|uniref:Pentatricopeptide repeat domain/PPR repeat n=1 Tax=Leishmania naiffi TaxID=5678 RepID=A0AAW3BMG2_9TRYP